MFITTDTFNRRPFRWNTTLSVADYDGKLVNVPARVTARTCVWLHPSRVLPPVLEALNNPR